jgi:hypothetical protein
MYRNNRARCFCKKFNWGIVQVRTKTVMVKNHANPHSQSTYYTQNETNPSYPMGVTYMDGEIKYDDFLKLFQERIMDDPVCTPPLMHVRRH